MNRIEWLLNAANLEDRSGNSYKASCHRAEASVLAMLEQSKAIRALTAVLAAPEVLEKAVPDERGEQ